MPTRDPNNDPKMRRSKPAPTEPDDPAVQGAETTPAHHPPRSPKAMRSNAIPAPATSTRANPAANALAMRKYGKTKEEIDAFITRHYHHRGPTWVGRQLGM